MMPNPIVSDDPETIVTPEFQQVFDLLEKTSKNVFLTGKAGTGKSTFLNYFRKNTEKNVVIVAPTGVAALNIQGQTIHSLFRFKPGFIQLSDIKPDRRKLFKELELLIIDEISMVRADVFNGIHRFLQLARTNSEPFGGVQICAIGDLFQLPPIVSREEKAFFAQYHASPFFFATDVYTAAAFQAVEFRTIHRQNDDAFIGILNAIRSGECHFADMEVLNRRVNPRVVPAPGTLMLTTTNALADDLNEARLASLPGETKIYKGDLKGEFGLKGPRLPASEELALKAGAQVMFVKNDPAGRWVNGTIGIVETLKADTISVKVGVSVYKVESEKWKTIRYEFSEIEEKIVEKALGSYTQFPLQLAWAITIHKSQGKTLERVIIDLGHGAFAAGQLYVALSRCRSLAGIALKQPVTHLDIRCDTDVVTFMKALAVSSKS